VTTLSSYHIGLQEEEIEGLLGGRRKRSSLCSCSAATGENPLPASAVNLPVVPPPLVTEGSTTLTCATGLPRRGQRVVLQRQQLSGAAERRLPTSPTFPTTPTVPDTAAKSLPGPLPPPPQSVVDTPLASLLQRPPPPASYSLLFCLWQHACGLVHSRFVFKAYIEYDGSNGLRWKNLALCLQAF
jgi:hypothetical protein